MVADGVCSIPCPCQPRPGEPCTPLGDHLARYLNAEMAGAINQDPPYGHDRHAGRPGTTRHRPSRRHRVGPAGAEGNKHVNRFYAHVEAGEPAVRLNDLDPGGPFVVIDFGSNWDFTSKDPSWCRRAATTWTEAAKLLDQAFERNRKRVFADEAGTLAARTASAPQDGSMALHDPSRPVRRLEGNPS